MDNVLCVGFIGRNFGRLTSLAKIQKMLTFFKIICTCMCVARDYLLPNRERLGDGITFMDGVMRISKGVCDLHCHIIIQKIVRLATNSL